MIDLPRRVVAFLVALLEERLALMAPARRLRLKSADRVLAGYAKGRPIRVLDAGCGDGLLTLALAKRHPRWQVVGIDRREDLLAGARARAAGRGLKNVSFAAADLLQPLPLGGFDAVAALECLSEIPDDEQALRMMSAAIAAGGILVAQAPDRDWKPVLSGSAPTWREQVRQGYDADGLTALVRRSGLEPTLVKGTYRSLTAAAQEIRDRIKRSPLGLRLLAFPALAAAVQLEHRGITWGRPNAILVVARHAEDSGPARDPAT
ncbi:MAG TPA: class I SAM-dependent methyltransferase [Solirubrobacterales bacterium]|jgi:SAM-dependent methyltransferase